MTPEDEAEIIALMRAAQDKARGYADFFAWAIDRDVEAWGVVTALAESMQTDCALFFSQLRRRGRPNDPPDCEALDRGGARLAIEVTELVSEDAIRDHKRAQREQKVSDWAEWNREKFIVTLTNRIVTKDRRFPELKEPPYPGGYVVVVHSDEPMLARSTVEEFLRGHLFEKLTYIDRAFLVLSYDPAMERCPYFELALHG